MARSNSPFPGMDPFLELHWLDVHGALIAETRKQLNIVLPDGLVARMEERIAVESDEDQERRAGPAVFVFKPSTGPWEKPAAGTVVIDAPYKVVVDLQPIIERSVRILNEQGQLITVVEFISPTNKKQPGLDAYLSKREELLLAGVYVVEVDLVRAGNWQALFQPHVCPRDGQSIYRATIRTPRIPWEAYLYPIHLKEPLPEIQIPLRPQDQKLMLPLQPMIEAVYADGRYSSTLDYTRQLNPPLSQPDQQFAIARISVGG